MTPEQFVYWLQGVFEVADLKTLDEKQVTEVRNHLALVLKKVTAARSEKPEFRTPRKLCGSFDPTAKYC